MSTQAERDQIREQDDARVAERMAVETEAPIVLTEREAKQGKRVGLIYVLAGGLSLVALAFLVVNFTA
jgi:hypothetical protein